MGRRSGIAITDADPDRKILLQSGGPTEFLRYLRRFLKPEYVPAESYVRTNLVLARGVELPDRSAARKGDAAYLTYRVDGRDFLIAQTFDGLRSLIGISVSLTSGEQYSLEQEDSIRTVVRAVCDTYLLPDADAPFEIMAEHLRHADAILISARQPEGGVDNYRQTLKGTYSVAGICLVFEKIRFYADGYKDPVPAWHPPADKYFDRMLGRYHAPQQGIGKSQAP